ncbi:SHOCT domain-containing protein [Thiocapsa roseopersicina]|uniref:Short C-terminal domain-containing protein n=1 Tax=Thiocapsa roseopersicina TaxID=1058 RepID=A0A1H2RFW5_THIRO|nr:SHOCT domain-containing protein [Thiocapsa roseopersicina]SDW18118.1 Short C-terminal domain-containing protein [Thiocapsa roseopersicina]
MQHLTPQGQQIVDDIARRHGFSQDAVTHMLVAVLNGNGGMAQFSHPEFGGSGQWMQGGMLMLGDMFNSSLKGRVDALCYELSNLLANQPGLLQSGSFQSQSQGGGSFQNQTSGGFRGESDLFVPDPADHWWPQELGVPNATGTQNNVKYAYFAEARRLAVNTGGDVWVYDTLDHQIGGFSQQQGMGGSISFGSQYGTIDLGRLPVVSRNGQSVEAPPPPAYAPDRSMLNQPAPNPHANEGDIFAAIERLGDLRAKGILTDDEFNAKKAELLARL